MDQQVPTPRQFLTTLINSLASIPVPSTISSVHTGPVNTGPSNPLKLIPHTYRPFLTTLYTLYPLTLLPALDLLDRRLATRVIINALPHQRPQSRLGVEIGPSSSLSPSSSKVTPENSETTLSTFYIVRSAQPQHPRRGESSSSTGLSYVVRLSAWNCTCAAFAFAAFPRKERESNPYPIDTPSNSLGSCIRQDDKSSRGTEWEFGALSADGTEGSGIDGVPCCKHLLACVLAERWDGLLGGYVDERIVSREEGAGLVADI
ncbi:uncharacterized protein GGS22DRAFT_100095 [Annulohypoxylon maeteangense]|uniref:uncharacterized protein n=1 Tax=Annulohypoxylon maeteangense TaxID=1927788 RepID=UPI0020089691|nr:uncharacterized protein GGS22DRAFT_100095 [Annulohypoxylon maeteangense]KAI0880131.1 hypothetical protein GGS22DRAFT_100095 [Annulohypoxylon maeteangense]